MRLVLLTGISLFILTTMQSCEERMELVPTQCNCDIDGMRLSEQRLVTYQVAVADGALVSSVTYQTNDGPITTDHPATPFSTTVLLAKGETIALQVAGHPGKGTITLTYETSSNPHTPEALSSSVSKVWAVEDGICR